MAALADLDSLGKLTPELDFLIPRPNTFTAPLDADPAYLAADVAASEATVTALVEASDSDVTEVDNPIETIDSATFAVTFSPSLIFDPKVTVSLIKGAFTKPSEQEAAAVAKAVIVAFLNGLPAAAPIAGRTCLAGSTFISGPASLSGKIFTPRAVQATVSV